MCVCVDFLVRCIELRSRKLKKTSALTYSLTKENRQIEMAMLMEFPLDSDSNDWQAFGDAAAIQMKSSDPFADAAPFGDDDVWTQKLEYGDATPTISSKDIEKYGYETTPESDGRAFDASSPRSKSNSSSYGAQQNRRRRHSIDHFSRENDNQANSFDPFSVDPTFDAVWNNQFGHGDQTATNTLSTDDVDKYGYGPTKEDRRRAVSSPSASKHKDASSTRSRRQGRRHSMEHFSRTNDDYQSNQAGQPSQACRRSERTGESSSSSSRRRNRSQERPRRRQSMEHFASRQEESKPFDRSSCQSTQIISDDGSDAFGVVSVNSKVKHFRKAMRRNSNDVLRRRTIVRNNSSNSLERLYNERGQQDGAPSNRQSSRSKSPSARRPDIMPSTGDDILVASPEEEEANAGREHPTTRRRIGRRGSIGAPTHNGNSADGNVAASVRSASRERPTNRRRRASMGKDSLCSSEGGTLGSFFKDATNSGAPQINFDDGTVYTTPVFSSGGSVMTSKSSSSSVYTTPAISSSSGTMSRSRRRRGSLGGSSALHGNGRASEVGIEDEYIDFRMTLNDGSDAHSPGSPNGKRLGGRVRNKDHGLRRSTGDRSRSGERSRRNRSGSPLSRKAPARSQSFEELSAKSGNRYRLEDRQSLRRQNSGSNDKGDSTSTSRHSDDDRSTEARRHGRGGSSNRRSKSPSQDQHRRARRRQSMV